MMLLLAMKLKNVSLGGFQTVFQMTEGFVGEHSVLQMFNFVGVFFGFFFPLCFRSACSSILFFRFSCDRYVFIVILLFIFFIIFLLLKEDRLTFYVILVWW